MACGYVARSTKANHNRPQIASKCSVTRAISCPVVPCVLPLDCGGTQSLNQVTHGNGNNTARIAVWKPEGCAPKGIPQFPAGVKLPAVRCGMVERTLAGCHGGLGLVAGWDKPGRRFFGISVGECSSAVPLLNVQFASPPSSLNGCVVGGPEGRSIVSSHVRRCAGRFSVGRPGRRVLRHLRLMRLAGAAVSWHRQGRA